MTDSPKQTIPPPPPLAEAPAAPRPARRKTMQSTTMTNSPKHTIPPPPPLTEAPAAPRPARRKLPRSSFSNADVQRLSTPDLNSVPRQRPLTSRNNNNNKATDAAASRIPKREESKRISFTARSA